jgi:5-carboxymethyl-2-hydroxymuconate isomerase
MAFATAAVEGVLTVTDLLPGISAAAVCHSISQATGVAARVVAFRAYSVGPGSEAAGKVELEVELPGRRVAVRASSTDVVEAAGRALVAALNQYNAKRQAQG